jgi:hypothetical protein
MLDDLRLQYEVKMRRLEPDEAAQERQCLEPAVFSDEYVVNSEEEFLSRQLVLRRSMTIPWASSVRTQPRFLQAPER